MWVPTTRRAGPPRCCNSTKGSRSSWLCSKGASWGPTHPDACSVLLKHTLPPLPVVPSGQRRAPGRNTAPAQPGACPQPSPSCWHKCSPDPSWPLLGPVLQERCLAGGGQGWPLLVKNSTALPQTASVGEAKGQLGSPSLPGFGSQLCLCSSKWCASGSLPCPPRGQNSRLIVKGDTWKTVSSTWHHIGVPRAPLPSTSCSSKVPGAPQANLLT